MGKGFTCKCSEASALPPSSHSCAPKAKGPSVRGGSARPLLGRNPRAWHRDAEPDSLQGSHCLFQSMLLPGQTNESHWVTARLPVSAQPEALPGEAGLPTGRRALEQRAAPGSQRSFCPI